MPYFIYRQLFRILKIKYYNWLQFPPSPEGEPGTNHPKYAFGGGARFYLQGNLAFMDVPGEYHYNKTTGVLYYYPQSGEEVLSEQEIIAPSIQEIFRLKGTDKAAAEVPDPAKQVRNITFKGLQVGYTEFTDMYSSGWNSFDAGIGQCIGYFPDEALQEGITQPSYCEQTERVEFRKGAFTLLQTNHITIDSVQILNTGMMAICAWGDNEHLTVKNSELGHIGFHGVNIDGGYPGPSSGQYSFDHVITNNVIHDIGELVGHGTGIQALQLHDSEFSHLEIYNSPRRAIFLMGAWANRAEEDKGFNRFRDTATYNNRFEYLYMHDLQHDGGDDGAFFCSTLYGSWGDTTGSRPNYIDQLYMDNVGASRSTHDFKPNGINLDMGCDGMELSNMMIVNPQHYNYRLDQVDEVKLENINMAHYDGAKNYQTFDITKMEFDKIGVSAEYPYEKTTITPKSYDDVYYRDEFDNGLDDWWKLTGKPETTPVYFSDADDWKGNSFFADAFYNKSPDGCKIGKPMGNDLNKIVEIDFFDHMCDGMEVGYCGQPFQYKLNSFARVDNGAHEKAMGVNHDISDKYYAYKVGSITKTTDIFREYGWHTFKWDYTSGSDVKMYIDGKLVATSVADSFNYIEMGDYGMGGFNAYDNVVIYGGAGADPIIPLPPKPDDPDVEEKGLTLPGKIQAEDATKLPNGVQITSISGGKAVGYLSPNTVFEFDLEVTEACELPLTVRYASPKDTGSLELTIGEKTISASSFPKTGDGDNGWNTYKEFTTSDKIALTPGKYTAQVKIIDNNFNFDWFALMDKAPIKPDTAVESVEFNVEGNLLLSVGNTTKIPYTVLPKTAANKAVTFESSNPDAVTVAEDGTVTAVAVGTSEITVTTADGKKTATCTVEVLDAEASLISTTAKGCVPTATSFDHVNYQAEKLMDGDITKSWAAAGSSNPAHLSDPSAYFTWDSPQDINTIYLYDNFEATNYVKSMEIIFDDDKADAYQIPTGVPDGGMLKVTLPQIKNGVKKIEFHITDAAGQYGNYGFGEIKVFSEEPGLIPVNSIRFAEDSTVKFVGETFTIKQPVITPSTATDQAFTMAVTGDEGVIHVTENRTDGKLTGYTITTLKEGKAAIEVTAAGDAKGKFEVTVGSKQAIEDAIMKAEALYSKYPGDSEAKIAFRAAIDEALKVYRESNDLTKIAEAIEALKKASDEFESSVSSGETAQEVADKLTVENPIKGSTSIKLPIVPVGYKVTIVSSSNEAIIAKNGAIKSPDTETQVNLTFKVTKVSDSTTGTKTLRVTVAGYSAEDAMNEIEISNPAKGAVKLILPTAPYGFKLEIVSSTENIISKDGTITPQLESKEVTLSVKMTKLSNNNFFNKDFTVTIIGTVKPFDVAIEAKDIDAVHGSAIKVQNNEVVNFNPGDWIRYDYVDFGKSPKNIKAKLNLAVHPDWAGKTIKIIMDDVTSGTALGEMVVDAGGAADWGQYHYQETDLTGRISGLHTIYLLGVAGGKNPTEGVAGVKEIQFTDVTPEGIKVESIAIKTAPTKTVYEVGEELDVTGGKITVTYSDKTNAEVNMATSTALLKCL